MSKEKMMISLTFPDGAERAFEAGVSGAAVAESIAKSLAKKAIAMKLDGTLTDLSEPITENARIEFGARESADA
ncbi:TGS domain-containing protein, partial [Mycobacterium tuberculosis]|nr:TGS domain-containing protein [Mycobacterium tuberculosis]